MADKKIRLLVKAEVNKAIKDLNHNQTIDPEEGIKRTVDWIKKQYS